MIDGIFTFIDALFIRYLYILWVYDSHLIFFAESKFHDYKS